VDFRRRDIDLAAELAVSVVLRISFGNIAFIRVTLSRCTLSKRMAVQLHEGVPFMIANCCLYLSAVATIYWIWEVLLQ
jgi:hypothetical protein